MKRAKKAVHRRSGEQYKWIKCHSMSFGPLVGCFGVSGSLVGVSDGSCDVSVFLSIYGIKIIPHAATLLFYLDSH